MFGIKTELMEVRHDDSLVSGSDISILVGLADGLRGSVVIGLSNQVALSIASSMMGGAQIEKLDQLVKSALGELGNMVVGGAIVGINAQKVINLSPPTLVVGENMFLVISRVTANELVFHLNGQEFRVAVAIE